MHDIDRGANPTAARLAAMAALRKAQENDSGTARPARAGSAVRGRMPRSPRDEAPEAATKAPHRLGAEGSAGVFSAIEVAIRKSRAEFLARLTVYREQLDCKAFGEAGTAGQEPPWDDALLVAHRISGVGRTLGFSDLGDAARQAEAAITAFKRERSRDMRDAAVERVCGLARLIEEICAASGNCRA